MKNDTLRNMTTNPIPCGFCGRIADVMHQDHIVPRSRGGGDEAWNCIMSCPGCNLEKSDRTPSEWKREGLPVWIYEVEKRNVIRYKMKPRGDRKRVAAGAISGWSLLAHRSPRCVEMRRPPSGGKCGLPADYEVCIPGMGPWTAVCAKCVRYYAKSCGRELDDASSLEHILVQLRGGVLSLAEETTLATIARLGGVSLAEYLDLAQRMVGGDDRLRTALKALAPQLRLELWEPQGPRRKGKTH